MRRLGMPISDDTILRHLKRNASRVDDDPPGADHRDRRLELEEIVALRHDHR
ncbi:hypothetical protein [Rhizobium sp. BR 362]|uniref:hypothetical protein n=1 Tax=Rhizobium sp. BR 362 TaxID=3040670 RepID=UPI003FA78E6C